MSEREATTQSDCKRMCLETRLDGRTNELVVSNPPFREAPHEDSVPAPPIGSMTGTHGQAMADSRRPVHGFHLMQGVNERKMQEIQPGARIAGYQAALLHSGRLQAYEEDIGDHGEPVITPVLTMEYLAPHFDGRVYQPGEDDFSGMDVPEDGARVHFEVAVNKRGDYRLTTEEIVVDFGPYMIDLTRSDETAHRLIG